MLNQSCRLGAVVARPGGMGSGSPGQHEPGAAGRAAPHRAALLPSPSSSGAQDLNIKQARGEGGREGVGREESKGGRGAFFPVCAKTSSFAAVVVVIIMVISMNESFELVPPRKQLVKQFLQGYFSGERC